MPTPLFQKGHAKVGGRVKGTPNHGGALAEIGELARVHGPACIAKLVSLMQKGPHAVAVIAARELLDRGYGKPKETIRNEFAFELMAERDLLALIEQNLPRLQGPIIEHDSASPVCDTGEQPGENDS